MKLNKKGQGLGGLITVIVVGLVFFAFFPFFLLVFQDVADMHSVVLKGMILLVPFMVVYFFGSWAFGLGAN